MTKSLSPKSHKDSCERNDRLLCLTSISAVSIPSTPSSCCWRSDKVSQQAVMPVLWGLHGACSFHNASCSFSHLILMPRRNMLSLTVANGEWQGGTVSTWGSWPWNPCPLNPYPLHQLLHHSTHCLSFSSLDSPQMQQAGLLLPCLNNLTEESFMMLH